ncbi:MAG: hypothetical protein ABEJ66_02070 [Candidatus Nanohaloarchaea archaeon]
MNEKKFHEFLYEAENWMDEFAIAVLSFGAIFVTIWTFFWAPQEIGFLSFGKLIEPWITMLALMIIAREFWLMNRRKRIELEEGE